MNILKRIIKDFKKYNDYILVKSKLIIYSLNL